MIDLDDHHLKQVKHIIARLAPECEARVFGSRVNGKAKPYSDLDLVLIAKQKMDWRRLEDIKQAFSGSDLPFMVDVIEWHDLSDDFKRLIQARYEVIQTPSGP